MRYEVQPPNHRVNPPGDRSRAFHSQLHLEFVVSVLVAGTAGK